MQGNRHHLDATIEEITLGIVIQILNILQPEPAIIFRLKPELDQCGAFIQLPLTQQGIAAILAV